MKFDELIERVETELGFQLKATTLEHNPLDADGEWQGPSISYFIVRDQQAYLVLANDGRDKFHAYTDGDGSALRFTTESEACDFLWERVHRIATRPVEPGWVRPSEEVMRLERERRRAKFERRLAEYNRENGIPDESAAP